jgi:hypothetical protein
MVKAELTIIKKDDNLQIDLDLLKREDWTQEEWELANTIQEILLTSIKLITENSDAKLIKQEIIK